MGAGSSIISARELSHTFGRGALGRRVLNDVALDIDPGEIVILTGPSGSGKTTLLTLVGGLRSVQEGSLEVLGRELNGASEAERRDVRRNIGYIFQAQNLLTSLTALANVEMSVALEATRSRAEKRAYAGEMLEKVGLGRHRSAYPEQLSGGQRQRVAIARALAVRPKIVLADEPTAALDKTSGREVVELMHDLAKKEGCAILLVTHDNRILDVADRIIGLEDGRLSSLTKTAVAQSQQMVSAIGRIQGRDELRRRVQDLSASEFVGLLDETTQEYGQFLRAMERLSDRASGSMLGHVLEAFTLKIGHILDAERVTVFLLDEARGELWSKVAQSDTSELLDIRVPKDAGIVGYVVASGKPLNVADAYSHPLFHRDVDERTGFRTQSILCVPVCDARGRVFAAIELLNRKRGGAFDASDERRLQEFGASIGVILETWVRVAARSGSPESVTGDGM